MLSKLSLLAFVSTAFAQSLSVTSPDSNTWWVASSVNTLKWSPCDSSITGTIPSFNVVLQNSNTQILAAPFVILGPENTFECSKSISPDAKPGTGYTITLTNPVNVTQVYATSPSFEIKAKGSDYPPQTTASSSSTSSGASPSASGNSTSHNGADFLQLNIAALLGAGALGVAML